MIDPFAVVAEADRMAVPDLWPGFDPREAPVAIYDGRNTLLFRHPAPPAGFQPVAGAGDARILTGRHAAVTANGTAELGGVRTATLIPPGGPVPVRTQAGVLIHEAFHVFQRERYPGWTANEVELFTYPVEDVAVLALRRAETETLRRALVDDDDAAVCWVRAAAELRRERLAGLPPGSATYERQVELFEGLATYVERRATAAPDSTLLPAMDFSPDAVRERANRSGAALARLLDRLRPGWRHELDRDASTTLDALLDHALAGRPPVGTPCAFAAGEAGAFRTAAARDIETLRDRRTAERDAFLDRAGWRIVVVADGQPLFPQGFDPLNVRNVAGGEVLHTRFLRLGNDSGTIEVLGRAALTAAAGAHPLFNGVRRLTITGLDAEPRIVDRNRIVTVEADGVSAELRGAAVERDGRTVILRLPSPVQSAPDPGREAPDVVHGVDPSRARATAETAPAAVIHRDVWGVPHVFSDTDRGAVFGMAWALAEDDWPLIEENYLHALGRYAELAGEAGVADDWMARALGIVPLSVREYERSSERMRGLLDAFAAGMNAWLATRPASDLRVLDHIEPWYPLALIRYKYYQNEFLGYAGLRQAWAERLMRHGWPIARDGGAGPTPPVGTSREARRAGPPRYFEAQLGPDGHRPHGSNQWAVAPARTADGHALLLINPHQRFVGVQRYAEIHLDSREGLRFSGLTVFGFLLPYMGHNGDLGWAYTDNYADHSDLYGLVFDDPANPLRYRYADGYRSAGTWTDSIRVRTHAGLETRTFRFWTTHHGPVVGVADDGRPLAVRLARFEEGGWFDQWDAMIRARSLDEWRGAVGMLRVAYMNLMYADRAGNIGYIYGSAVPRRHPGVDPSGILDGADPRTEWLGFHDLDELPQVFNPPAGWLLNANSEPFTATPGLPFTRTDFPPYMVGPETDNWRARGSRRVLEAMDGVTFDEFADRVWDSRLGAADSILPLIESEWRRRAGGAPAEMRGRLDPVVRRLAAWDRVADTASVETTWFVLATELRARASSAGMAPGWPWTDALAEVLGLVEAEWGTIAVPWGSLNRHQRPLPGAPLTLDRTRPSLAVGGGPGHLGSVFTYHAAPFGSAGPRLGIAGNSFVKVIEFGPAVRALSILNYGQSGDPASPHYFDQAGLYAERRFKPAWFTREEVEANAVRTYGVTGRSER